MLKQKKLTTWSVLVHQQRYRPYSYSDNQRFYKYVPMFLLQEKHISEEIKNLHVLRIYTYYCKLDSRFKHSRRFL